MIDGWHLVGDDAVLVDLPDAGAVTRLAAALRVAPPDGVVDVVPAERTVLEGKAAVALPLRFVDGTVYLGPIQDAKTPPLF